MATSATSYLFTPAMEPPVCMQAHRSHLLVIAEHIPIIHITCEVAHTITPSSETYTRLRTSFPTRLSNPPKNRTTHKNCPKRLHYYPAATLFASGNSASGDPSRSSRARLTPATVSAEGAETCTETAAPANSSLAAALTPFGSFGDWTLSTTEGAVTGGVEGWRVPLTCV